MNKKKLVRERFRTQVFTRDKYKCKVCNDSNETLDAHHITNRNKMPNGGYVKENGITLCPSCHLDAENFYTVGTVKYSNSFLLYNLYEMIGSSYELAVEKSKLL